MNRLVTPWVTSFARVGVRGWSVVVVGVDGCRDGWIAVVWRAASVDVHYWPSLAELHGVPDVAAVAIDIPLGLSANGERRCDALARRELGARASTLFNAPARACLEARDDYHRANEISRSRAGKGLSRQSFGLLHKIGEVDDVWSTLDVPLYEVHPELAFARLHGGVPLASKKTWEGLLTRRDLLAAHGIVLEGFRGVAARRAAPDDVLDAGVCAWIARRIADGDVRRLPDPPDVDDTGREMCIRV